MEAALTHKLSVQSDAERQISIFLLVLAGCLFGYALSCVLTGPVNDEQFHGAQIWHYYSGGDKHFSNITMFSTYHYIMGFIVNSIGYYHDYLLRFINLAVSLCLLPVFYLTALRYNPQLASVRTAQLFYAPLVFPYFFLIYTDIWALLFIALCFYFTIGKQYILAGVLGFCAIAIRQDSVIWVGLAYLLICFDGISLRRPLPYRELLRNAFVRGGPLALVFLLFIAFVIYNGGVAVGDVQAHQIQNFNISNLYVFLLCGWLLFLPLCIQQLPKIIALRKKPWVWALVVAGFFVYMTTLTNTHGYNRIMYDYFLHNGLLYLLTEYAVLRAMLYVPIAWMALTLCVMEYPDKRCYWLLLVIPLSAISHPLVEPRYYFPAYLLINLWRPAMSMTAEKTTLGIYMALAAFIMFGSVKGLFFL
jgi:alpha-1,2-glucosyltransferase